MSVSRFKKYADHFGADYIFQTKPVYSPESSFYEKLRIIYDTEFDKYDEILYTDVDVIPEVFDKSIFDENVFEVGLIREKPYPNMTNTPYHSTPVIQEEYKSLSERHKKSMQMDGDKYVVYNTGVMLWTRLGIIKARQNFMNWRPYFGDSNVVKGMNLDQPFINLNLKDAHLNITELPIQYNCFPRPSWVEGHFPKDVVFTHYTGGKKKYIIETYKIRK